MGKITLLILKGDDGFDISDLVKTVVWSGKKSSAARTIEVTMLDDYNMSNSSLSMDLSDGWTCIFKWNDEELFRGIIMKQSVKPYENKWKAYDVCMYLSNSKDSFSFENVIATQVFENCISRAGLEVGKSTQTNYLIDSLIKSKTTLYDCILDALSTTYKNTGERYYIRASENKVDLLRRAEEMTQWVVEVGENIVDFSYTESIEKIKTRYRIFSKEGTILKEVSNTDLENKLGSLVAIDQADEDYTEAGLQEMVQNMIEESGRPVKSLSATTMGIISAISGGCLYVIIPQLNIKRTFYIDEDKHTFNGEKHTMTVKLNFATDIDSAG
ncbi:MAG: hypothetical protein IJ054_07745 [Lachnospiraceae bacterium]|nr:hypothetical protein [Lachnospiraceae bacterium]